MRNMLCLAIAFLLSGCAGAFPVKPEDMTYQRIIELPRESKETIFEKSKQWIAQSFRSAKAVIEYDNKEEGIIIGNGTMDRPYSAINITAGNLISYTMREDIKDGKVRLTFDHFIAIVRPSYNTITGVSPGGEADIRQADLEGMRASFDTHAANLQAYILNSKAASNW